MSAEHIPAWLIEWAGIWNSPELLDRVQVVPGKRLRTSLGRCQPATGRIQLHPALFALEGHALFREIVCHEVAHVAVHLLHGEKVRPHGAQWKELVAAAGYPPVARMDPLRLPRQVQSALQPTVLYLHRCPVCRVTRSARRRVRNWRCRACRKRGLSGLLRIFRRVREAR